MPEQLRSTLLLIGRILISQIFLLAGVMKLTNWDQTASMMEQHGMPAVAVLLPIAVLFELVGGLCILFGWWPRAAAVALIVFLIPATVTFHNFWTYQDPQQMANQMQHFQKNLAIMGGLLTLAAAGAGAFSCDAWLRGSASAQRNVGAREPVTTAR